MISTAITPLIETAAIRNKTGAHRMQWILALILFSLVTHSAYAKPLDGLLIAHNGIFGSSARITGFISTITDDIQINSTSIYGVSATFLVTELLGPGTYTRTHNITTGGSITRTGTIPVGKTGAYFVIAHNGNEYQIFNAWTVSTDESNYNNYNIATNKAIGGNLDGTRLQTRFSTTAGAPFLDLTINVVGGPNQNCSETGGSTITANADIFSDDVILDRVEWWLDGIYQGNGTSKSFFVPVGSVSIEAIAYATDGVTSGSYSIAVRVFDSSGPTLDILFIDGSGNVVTTAQPGDYTIRFNVSDACDPDPAVISASAKPVMEIIDGDIISIDSSNDVRLPTTAVEVTATAADASGNNTIVQAILTLQ